LPLILHNAVTTRNAKPGDPVYLETLFPVVVDNRILIPAGSYVQGEIQEARRPGKVKGTGEIRLRLNSMILPNGYAVDFNAIPTNAGTGGNEATDSEGKVHGDTDKGNDVGTILKTTGIGAGVGGIATQSAKGAGIGAGAGAAVGLAAVIGYEVMERTHEFGIRMALGAQSRDVVRMVLRQGMTLALIGVAIGLTLAAGVSRALGSLLFGVGPADPLAFGGSAAVFCLIGLAACYVPARRATEIEATEALRYE